MVSKHPELEGMHDRVRALRGLQPNKTGVASYEAILEAAAGLFLQFPAESITLRDILSVSGVSNQTLYNHFPEGRDDVAIVLFDRFQRTIVHDFRALAHQARWDPAAAGQEQTRALSADFVRACFGYLRNHFQLLQNVWAYLKLHGLVQLASHHQDLADALAEELAARFGDRLPAERRPVVAALCAHLGRSLGEFALQTPGLALDDLETQARRLVRATLQAELEDALPSSGGQRVPAYQPAPIAVLPSRLSESKKRTILERILKRRKRS